MLKGVTGLVEKVNEQIEIWQRLGDRKNLPPFTEDDALRLIGEGRLRHAEYYSNSDAGKTLGEWIKKNKPRRRWWQLSKRFERWLKTRLNRGKHRAVALTKSLKYKKQLRQLRIKWGIPERGFSSGKEARSWELALAKDTERFAKEGTANARLPVNALRRDCEELAIKFKVFGDWAIVRRHMLYAKVRVFMVDEGWQVVFDNDGIARFDAGNATHEGRRHGWRLFKQIFQPQRRHPQGERDKAWYDAIVQIVQSGKGVNEAIRDIAKGLASQEGGHAGEDKYFWRVKQAYQREKRRRANRTLEGTKEV